MSKVEFLYPAENAFRHQRSLNGSWYFTFNHESRGKWESGIPHNQIIPVPAAIQDVFYAPEERNWCGDLWYEKNIYVPKEWLGEDVYIRFDNISRKGVVYLNGVEIGRHEGLYVAAIFDITKHVRYGEDNKFVVKVNTEAAPQDLLAGNVRKLPSGRKVNVKNALMNALQQPQVRQNQLRDEYVPLVGEVIPHGLIGNVQIYSLPQNRILDISVQTVEATKEKAILQYMIQVQGNCLVTATLRDGDGRVVATGVGGNTSLTIERPQLWEPGHPYLYYIDFEVSRLGKQHDYYRVPVGVRTAELKAGKLFVNGQEFFLRANRLWQGYDQVLKINPSQVYLQIQKIIKSGGNCLFAGGYTLPKYVLDIADELGVFVISEMPVTELESSNVSFSVTSQERYLEALKRIMQRDKNHASLLMWSVFNAPQISIKSDEKYLIDLVTNVKKLDWQHRPVGITLYQGVKDLPDSLVSSCDFIILNQWLYNNNLEAEELQLKLYKELIEWQAKYSEQSLFISMPGYQKNVHAAGIGALLEMAEAYYKDIYTVLLRMPNVQGILLYDDFLVNAERMKSLWFK